MAMDLKKYVKDDILRFWLDHSIDEENGGIFNSLDREGRIYSRNKNVWFQGRALWTFSRAYNTIEARDEYLHAAKKMVEFLPKCTGEDGRMHFSVTEKGEKILQRQSYFSELFAAIGLSEYYKITGNKEIWSKAEKYFDLAFGVYKNSIDPDKFAGAADLASKSLSYSMIMLNTAKSMASTGENAEKYNKIMLDCASEIIHGGYFKEEYGALIEQVDMKGNFVDSVLSSTINPGHSLECAWFLMDTGNDEAIATAKKIIDYTMPIGVDKKNGGIIAFTEVMGRPPAALEWDMKIWWPQCEAIIANRMAYDMFGENKYLEAYQELLDYVFKHFPDREHGEWYGYLHYDNTVSNTLKGNISKGPFHLPRMLMMMGEYQSR